MAAFVRTAITALALSAAATGALAGAGDAQALERAEATIINTKGETIGTATFVERNAGVVINIRVRGLEPGPRGMHFHAIGTCADPEEGFKATAGHIMPSGKPHGYLHADGPHEGNLPNLIVHRDGTADVELYSDLVRISEGPAALLDEDGSTLIIHQNQDDHVTQPIGNAGPRVACGVVRPHGSE